MSMHAGCVYAHTHSCVWGLMVGNECMDVCRSKCILQREHEKACVCVYTGAARVFVVGRMGERANYISIYCTVTLAPVPVQRGPKVASLFKGAGEGR